MAKAAPTYRQRKDYPEHAIVTLTDARTGKRRDYWLGEFGSRQSRERYHRLLAAWESGGRALPDPRDDPPHSPAAGRGDDAGGITVAEVVMKFWTHCKRTYVRDEGVSFKIALRLLRAHYGSEPAASFGPLRLRALREAMIAGDPAASPPRKPWSRAYINSQVKRIQRMFRWAASHELIPPSVPHGLATVEALRRGRSGARETEPVGPVPMELVEAIKPHTSRQVGALIDLQLLTGARPGELVGLRAIDIDTTKSPWRADLRCHKNAHRGKSRTVYFGPRAQAVLAPFMATRPVDAPLFSPREAERERYAACGTHRKAEVVPASTERMVGDAYSVSSYRRAIQYACDLAFPVPEGHDEAAWRKAHRWHPNQLRHTAATEIRREFGLEAAQLVLGHSSALVTEAVYAARDEAKVAEVLRKVG